jgi:hypothetical protein
MAWRVLILLLGPPVVADTRQASVDGSLPSMTIDVIRHPHLGCRTAWAYATPTRCSLSGARRIRPAGCPGGGEAWCEVGVRSTACDPPCGACARAAESSRSVPDYGLGAGAEYRPGLIAVSVKEPACGRRPDRSRRMGQPPHGAAEPEGQREDYRVRAEAE